MLSQPRDQDFAPDTGLPIPSATYGTLTTDFGRPRIRSSEQQANSRIPHRPPFTGLATYGHGHMPIGTGSAPSSPHGAESMLLAGPPHANASFEPSLRLSRLPNTENHDQTMQMGEMFIPGPRKNLARRAVLAMQAAQYTNPPQPNGYQYLFESFQLSDDPLTFDLSAPSGIYGDTDFSSLIDSATPQSVPQPNWTNPAVYNEP